MKVWGLISELLSVAMSRYRIKRIQERLLAAYPDCILKSHEIYDTTIGRCSAVLDGARLRRVSLGEFSYVSINSSLNNAIIGKYCSIGPNVQIGLAQHPARIFVSTYPAFNSNENCGCPLSFRKNSIFDGEAKMTNIGNDVWIGSSAIIPGGIQVGTGSIVAAGSVVVRDVPPYAIVGGNPANIIRYRFSETHIEALLASKWWDWPLDKVLKNIERFSDIEDFSAYIQHGSH